jgi:hypothetical protein
MLIDYIYSKWTTSTGDLAKPATMQGQSNKIEFREGLVSDFKSLQVLTLEDRTQAITYEQTGQNRILLQTDVMVTVKAVTMPMNVATYLNVMDQEIINIAGTYRSAVRAGNGITGIKDLVYNGRQRIYKETDTFDKSDWRSVHSIGMLYELVDNTA